MWRSDTHGAITCVQTGRCFGRDSRRSAELDPFFTTVIESGVVVRALTPVASPRPSMARSQASSSPRGRVGTQYPMSQIFHRSANTLSKVSIVGVLVARRRA